MGSSSHEYKAQEDGAATERELQPGDCSFTSSDPVQSGRKDLESKYQNPKYFCFLSDGGGHPDTRTEGFVLSRQVGSYQSASRNKQK